MEDYSDLCERLGAIASVSSFGSVAEAAGEAVGAIEALSREVDDITGLCREVSAFALRMDRRAEAAEAEIVRLREALGEIAVLGTLEYANCADANLIARAALSPPVSEGTEQ